MSMIQKDEMVKNGDNDVLKKMRIHIWKNKSERSVWNFLEYLKIILCNSADINLKVYLFFITKYKM